MTSAKWIIFINCDAYIRLASEASHPMQLSTRQH